MPTDAMPTLRIRLNVGGRVQGVGFRPFIYRLARRCRLRGFVANTNDGATIEIEGTPTDLDRFRRALETELPPLARITRCDRRDVSIRGDARFEIHASESIAQPRAEVSPDVAVCPDCLADIRASADRRYRYPFTNCTNCGPRYSIIHGIPYDRPQTTMASFPLCPHCKREYADPVDRRFHAQPVACAACGPRLELLGPDGIELDGDPLQGAARLLVAEKTVAIKGIGGFHLACRAESAEGVRRLRKRKHRDGKPLAVMVRDLETAERLAMLTSADRLALTNPAAPIVLAPKRPGHGLAEEVAPGCRDFGLMLPYTPLHHLLFDEDARLSALVMTSANRSSEPLVYRDADALVELAGLADALLIHDRAIARPIDDSVAFTFRDAWIPVRRARGFVPEPLYLRSEESPAPRHRILALGADLKNTFCLLHENRAVLSEHLGDLASARSFRHFLDAQQRLKALFDFEPDLIAHDLHPSYVSTRFAERQTLPRVAVQHHHAHVASVMAEHGNPGPVVGLACDGTGFGTDGAIWGGELLLCARGDFERISHLNYFPLLGGDAAAVETWRSAAGVLYAAFGTRWRDVFDALRPGHGEVLDVWSRQWSGQSGTVQCSSLGRLFDAVAFLLNVCDRNRHEAEAAMALEELAGAASDEQRLSTGAAEGALDWRPVLRALVAARLSGQHAALLSTAFHTELAGLLANAAIDACAQRRLGVIALSGGCFLNRRLLREVVERIEAAGLAALYNRQVPANDGGISLGQAFVAEWRSRAVAPA